MRNCTNNSCGCNNNSSCNCGNNTRSCGTKVLGCINCSGRNSNSPNQTVPPTKSVRALINTVLDSCCTFDEIEKDVIIPVTSGCDLCKLKLGDSLPIEIDGDVCGREVNREDLDCTCLSTVLVTYPIKFEDPCADPCACEPPCIHQTFTSLHSVNLCCSANSVLNMENSRVVNLSAIITHICPDYIVVSVVIGARICMRQTVMQEHCLNVADVVTQRCEERESPDKDCKYCNGTYADSVERRRVPFSEHSGYFRTALSRSFFIPEFSILLPIRSISP